MIHLTFAIGQFFEIMLGAILRAVGTAIAIGGLVVMVIGALALVVREVLRRHRR